MAAGAILLITTGLLVARQLKCPQFGRTLLSKVSHRWTLSPAEIEFTRTTSGSGVGPRGSTFEIFQFRSPECIHTSSWYNLFKSESDAESEVSAAVASADRVLEHNRMTTASGETGERAVIWRKSEDEYVVIRRVQLRVHSLASPSLAHALELEKRTVAQEDEVMPISRMTAP